MGGFNTRGNQPPSDLIIEANKRIYTKLAKDVELRPAKDVELKPTQDVELKPSKAVELKLARVVVLNAEKIVEDLKLVKDIQEIKSKPIYSQISEVATEHQVHPPWELLDPNDPNVINAAKFAVLEYNKNVTSSSNKLLFQKVNWCEYAYLAGAFYGLDIAAKNESLPSPPQNYIVGVWARLNRPLKLRVYAYFEYDSATAYVALTLHQARVSDTPRTPLSKHSPYTAKTLSEYGSTHTYGQLMY
ncbi:hypothetical protein PRUPE_6G335600 [Prunus persica]|uniref:Cystatin domain-containing protein n=1 Tax=Prunus persica TaxID=3760 RepID=A0A251NZI3_PRUPE|nr:hypothetical protein PRUPE_6G335600 [Prunus persica]